MKFWAKTKKVLQIFINIMTIAAEFMKIWWSSSLIKDSNMSNVLKFWTKI